MGTEGWRGLRQTLLPLVCGGRDHGGAWSLGGGRLRDKTEKRQRDGAGLGEPTEKPGTVFKVALTVRGPLCTRAALRVSATLNMAP